jgi:hypothetical protein
MNERSPTHDVALDAECSAFCAYLVGREASEYIRQRYREAHRQTDLVPQDHSNAFDRFIVRFGQRGILCTRMADIYTRWFYRRSALRSKLLLLMAILECSKSTYSLFEASQSSSKTRFGLRLLAQGIRWVLCLIASFVFFSVSYPVAKCADRIGKISRAKYRWIRS